MESRKFIKPTNGNEVVITGMAGKFPDSHNINHLRENLFNKVDMVSADFRRWKPTHPEIPQRTGKLLDIHKFDPGFFGITSVQTEHMDPMIRMALECAIEAVIDAGLHPSDLEHTNTAVFVGVSFSETERFTFYEVLTSRADAFLGCGDERIFFSQLVESFAGGLILLAYSFGCIVATELLRMLEAKGKTAKVIFIDGSPDFSVNMTNALFPTSNDNLIQTIIISLAMSRHMPYDDILKRQEVIAKFPTHQEKIDYVLSISPQLETSRAHLGEIYTSIYNNLKALKIGIRTDVLRSSVTLFKAKFSALQKTDADYGLSKLFLGGVDVVTIEGDHVTILESEDLASKINAILKSIE